MLEIKVLNKPDNDNPFLIIFKPSGLPSAPLTENDTNNALFQAIKIFPKIKEVKGTKEIEFGLLHRIDNATKGLILIALTQEFYDYMKIQQTNNNFIKFYKAKCILNGNIPESFDDSPINFNSDIKSYYIESYFRYFGEGHKSVRPVSINASKIQLKKVGKLKKYITNVKILQISENQISVLCKISQGFKHQVRAHLAWCGLPIIGDEIYNLDKSIKDFEFEAIGLEFNYKNKKYAFGITDI